nr:MAG: hypothetical protein CSA42_08515 [Gammaproteobacteria bacterium]
MTRSQKQVEQAYRQALFNVIFNNKDDHSKNFSFIMDKSGKWSLSPAYDITFNTGTNGYHQMAVCGEARQPTKADLLQLAQTTDIKTKVANEIIDNTVTLAKKLQKTIFDYPLQKPLAETVEKTIAENINRI